MKRLFLKCPMCDTWLDIIETETVESIIMKNIDNHVSRFAYKADACGSFIEKGFTLDQEYHRCFCKACGYLHDGLGNARKIFR